MIRVLCLAFLILAGSIARSEDTVSQPTTSDSTTVVQILNRDADVKIRPILTDSPRRTMETFLRLRKDMEASLSEYIETRTVANYARVRFLSDQLLSLVDTSGVPEATRERTGSDTSMYLLDTLGRIDEIDTSIIPDFDTDGVTAPAKYRLPGTSFDIVVVTEGPRFGEFLFSSETNYTAPRFYLGISSLPLRSSASIESWINMSRQISGPLIPVSALADLPSGLTSTLLDTPLWKVLLVLVIVIAAIVTLRLWHYVLIKKLPQSARDTPRFRILNPIAVMLTTMLLERVFGYQINISGRFYDLSMLLLLATFYPAAAWAFWLSCRAYFETVVLDPTFPDKTLDASMVRLVGQIIGLVGGVLILAYGMNQMGAPVLSLLTGLGIGGIAVALAVRPTLENLIGGFILYLDRPVRVGDYCTFGGSGGTVESIGVRSTAIRAIDRTLITIPNAQFADLHLINWSKCDLILFLQPILLRHEATPDQLHYILAKIREMLTAHPLINQPTIHVRLSSFGPSEIKIDTRAHVKTNIWAEYYSVREDVLFRMKEIVREAGCSFALPSQTLYMAKDPAPDSDLVEQASKEVDAWRKHNQFPFPDMPAEQIEALKGTLEFPPAGSPDHRAPKADPDAGDDPAPTERKP